MIEGFPFWVQRSPFRVGRERVKKFNHEGHEDHEVKRWIIVVLLNLPVLHALHGEKVFVLKEKRFCVPRSGLKNL